MKIPIEKLKRNDEKELISDNHRVATFLDLFDNENIIKSIFRTSPSLKRANFVKFLIILPIWNHYFIMSIYMSSNYAVILDLRNILIDTIPKL